MFINFSEELTPVYVGVYVFFFRKLPFVNLRFNLSQPCISKSLCFHKDYWPEFLENTESVYFCFSVYTDPSKLIANNVLVSMRVEPWPLMGWKNFLGGSASHIETSPLICSANQLTGFFMIEISVMKELRTILSGLFDFVFVEELFILIIYFVIDIYFQKCFSV